MFCKGGCTCTCGTPPGYGLDTITAICNQFSITFSTFQKKRSKVPLPTFKACYGYYCMMSKVIVECARHKRLVLWASLMEVWPQVRLKLAQWFWRRWKCESLDRLTTARWSDEPRSLWQLFNTYHEWHWSSLEHFAKVKANTDIFKKICSSQEHFKIFILIC